MTAFPIPPTGPGDTASRPTSQRGPRVRTAIIVAVAGMALLIPSIVVLGSTFWRTITGDVYRVPGTIELQLGTGPYTVYEWAGNQDNSGPVQVGQVYGTTLDSATVRVTGPSGLVVPVRQTGANEWIDRDNDRYVAVLTFDARNAGRYRVAVDSDAPTTVLVQRSLGETFRRSVGWIGGMVLGGLLVTVGFVLLIVGLVRRSNTRRQHAVVLPPAGWHPDPHRTHRLRYWDGQRWTDHTAD